VGLVQGAAHVTAKLAAPVSTAIGSLKVAVMIVLFIGTPVALLIGATAVTVGASAATRVPRMGSRPQPTVRAHRSVTTQPIWNLGSLSDLIICFTVSLDSPRE
jgi:hypothetical protein